MSIMSFFITFALVATLITLILGVYTMFKGDKGERSNALMQLRVGLQGVAILLLGLALYYK